MIYNVLIILYIINIYNAMDDYNNQSESNEVTIKPSGFSQHTFMEYMRSNKNLNICIDRPITIEEVKKHTKAHDCWIVYKKSVYDITHYLKYHPGGSDHLLNHAGTDITSDVMQVHQWVNIELILENCKVGDLEGLM